MAQKSPFCVIGGFLCQRLKTTASVLHVFTTAHRDLTYNVKIVSAIFLLEAKLTGSCLLVCVQSL